MLQHQIKKYSSLKTITLKHNGSSFTIAITDSVSLTLLSDDIYKNFSKGDKYSIKQLEKFFPEFLQSNTNNNTNTNNCKEKKINEKTFREKIISFITKTGNIQLNQQLTKNYLNKAVHILIPNLQRFLIVSNQEKFEKEVSTILNKSINFNEIINDLIDNDITTEDTNIDKDNINEHKFVEFINKQIFKVLESLTDEFNYERNKIKVKIFSKEGLEKLKTKAKSLKVIKECENYIEGEVGFNELGKIEKEEGWRIIEDEESDREVIC